MRALAISAYEAGEPAVAACAANRQETARPCNLRREARPYGFGARTGGGRYRPDDLGRNRRMNKEDVKRRRGAPLATPTGLGANATQDISGAMNAVLADMFA